MYHCFINSLITPSTGFWFDLSLYDECPLIPYFLSIAWNSVLVPTCSLTCIVSVAIIQSNCLTSKILSALYMRLSGIIANCLRCYVASFSVSFACAKLILHISLQYSGVVFECRSDDMYVHGFLNYSCCSDGSGTTPSVTFFPSFLLCIISVICLLVTNSATRLYSSIVVPSILFAWVSDTLTLATILLFNSCVPKITFSSSKTGVSPGSSRDCLKFMARLEMFCA